MSASDYSFLFMYKLLNCTFMFLLELLLLESSNSKTDFIVLAVNIEIFLSCWSFHFFFPHCKNRDFDISIKDTAQHNHVLYIKKDIQVNEM